MMKKIVFVSMIAVALASAVGSCDKVENPFPKDTGGLDWSLYPDGDSAHYAQNHWPTFTANTNTQRNVIIEDFTGHRCVNCPNTAAAVHAKVISDPDHIYAASIHSGPAGMTSFQELFPAAVS